MLSQILSNYGFNEEPAAATQAFGSGLINHTWKVTYKGHDYILQRINDNVFKTPESIAQNISLAADYFQQNHPGYLFVAPVKTLEGKEMFHIPGTGYFRMFPFVENSHTVDVVNRPEQAYEAATQFGRFTHLLHGIDTDLFKTTIPDFHNLSLRYVQFKEALKNGNPERIQETEALANELLEQEEIVEEYKNICSNPEFRIRVTHHDTKISNVLFDEAEKGICVIDLDTVMPGYFISDVGDMMRTYLSPFSEEEQDFSKIEIREDFYKAIVNGYYNEMKDVLTETEKKSFFYSGTFMIYMQAIRFLTDYLNNDVYYGSKYPGHNLMRAGNQAILLKRLLQKKEALTGIIKG